MAKITLSGYIKRIEAKYIKAREEYEKKAEELEGLKIKHDNLDKSLYSPQGLTKINAEYDENRRKALIELEEIRQNFIKAAADIQTDSDKVFDRVYEFTPELVDASGLAILDGANLSDREIRRLARGYQERGNNTMLFICAERLKNLDDPENFKLRAEAHKLREDRPDHDILDGFTESCAHALRDNRVLADGIAAHHDEFLLSHLAAADQIAADVPDVWK